MVDQYKRVALPKTGSISHLDLGRYFNESYQSGFSGNKYPISMDDTDPRHLIRKFNNPISLDDYRGACWGLPSWIDETPYWGYENQIIDPPEVGYIQRRKTSYGLSDSGTDVQPVADGMFISLTQNASVDGGVAGGGAVGFNGYWLLDDTSRAVDISAEIEVTAMDGGELDKVEPSLVVFVGGYANGYINPLENSGRKEYYLQQRTGIQQGVTYSFTGRIQSFELDMAYRHMVCNATVVVQPVNGGPSGGGIARVQAVVKEFLVKKA